MPHKTEDFKLSAVKFYLKNKQSMDKVSIVVVLLESDVLSKPIKILYFKNLLC
jgi:hypothetical protein